MSEKLREEFESNTGRRLVWDRSAWAEYAIILESTLLREREEHEEHDKQRAKAIEMVTELDKNLYIASNRIKELEAQIEAMRERDVTAIFRGLPVLVNKYLPKRTLMVSEDLAETLQM